MHPYSVIRSICEENDLLVTLMPGSRKEYCTFIIKNGDKSSVTYGSCQDEIVRIGLTRGDYRIFDLHDPNSISKIESAILSMCGSK